MINKISARSECFDIFASKMQPMAISKRAGIWSSLVGESGEWAKILVKAAQDIEESFGPGFAAFTKSKTADKAAIKGLSLIEKTTPSELNQIGVGLKSVSLVKEASNDISELVRPFYDFAKYEDFLTAWTKDMASMSAELKASGGKMTDLELEAFYLKHKKPIETMRLLMEDKTALSDANIAAGKSLAAAGVTTPKTLTEIASASKSPGGIASLSGAGYAGAAGVMAIKSAPVLVLTGGLWALGSWLLSSDRVKDEVDRISAAIKCIDAIKVISGSPAARDRDIIINNLKTYLANSDHESSIAAQKSLGGGADSEGSITHFVSIISSDPGQNLSGFAGYTGSTTLAAGLVGAAAGFKLGGLLGAAIGAAVAGGAGWFFISTYYKDQINCLSGAIDAMDSIARLAASEQEKKNGGEKPEALSGPPNGPARSEINILAKILVAMSENKLVGKRGPNLVNEKNLINSLLERATNPSIAASALIQSNYNIATAVKSDSIQGIIGAIDRGAVHGNPELKALMQDIIDTVPNAIRALQQGKIKESKILHTRLSNMKKLSTSTNQGTIKKKAEESKASYFGDANLGLQDSLTKSYYAGLTGMYNEKLPSRSSDYKDLYGFQEETGPDLVQQSHSKSVTLADAMGKGGLVENGLEQQEKSHYVATSTPSGNFQSKYAQTLKYLTKLAEAADEQGKKDVSELINQTIKTLK